ncbi:MAG: spore cortex-lytic protein [Oscillospiraceae bacterium]|nr:spore cortex-lytic protein [Oscillospiraceae bacterium]
MPSQGTLDAHVYTSDAVLPIEDAAIAVYQTHADGGQTLLSVRRTDENGMISAIPIDTPPIAESQTPGTPQPFTAVTLIADHPDYEIVKVETIPIFQNVATLQNIMLIPLPLDPAPISETTEVFQIPPQNL